MEERESSSPTRAGQLLFQPLDLIARHVVAVQREEADAGDPAFLKV